MINRDKQKHQAEEFLALHHAPTILILANAWDVASEKIFEHEGFKAIGTTSAGISSTLGYADVQKMNLAENLQIAQRIVNNTTLPVSADIEAGYATSIEGVAKAAQAVLEMGAVGLNLDDSTGDPIAPFFDTALQQDKIRAIGEMAVAQRIHLVINARTDVIMFQDESPQTLREAIDRGNAYREAGTDCIFVPDVGNLDKKTIPILVREIDAPVHIIAGATTPSIPELQELGVARVSLGPRPMRAVLSQLRKIAKELMTTGTYQLMAESSISYPDVNQWFTR